MAWEDEEEKSFGRFESKDPKTPRNDKGALCGYYILSAFWIAVSIACFYFGYDLINNGKGMASDTSIKAGIFTFHGAAGVSLIFAGLVIACYAIKNLNVKLT